MSVKKPSPKFCSLEVQVRRTIRKNNMITAGEHVLVAVSGGADSIALLICLHKLAPHLGISLTAAHLNHRIRGAEADDDEEFVRRMCSDLAIPFVSEAMEVKQLADEAKQNLEEFARRKRYDFLRSTAHRIGAQKIAVGHSLNDQAETALFRFIRGSGIEGLSGIHPIVDDLVIRPLLECTRDSIRQYLKEQRIAYREDSTNADLRYARNRIRRELLPYLENNFNPRLASTIAREAGLARETWSFIEAQAMEAFNRLHCRIANGISIKVKGLLELHAALQKQVLRQALKACQGSLSGITAIHIQNLLSICATEHSGDQIKLPRGSMAVRQFEDLLLLKRPLETCPEFNYRLDIPGKCHIAEIGAWLQSTICSAPDLKAMKGKRFMQAFLKPSHLPQSLTIRSRMPGDRYGGSGHRKVKKMLIDGKIPQSQRSALPMVTTGDSVIWIPGFRPARGYESSPESKNSVRIELIRNE
jgi:tRNA(Ile)-lysidine synthase